MKEKGRVKALSQKREKASGCPPEAEIVMAAAVTVGSLEPGQAFEWRVVTGGVK